MPDPDPLDGRDDGMDPRPFTLPCRHEAMLVKLVRALAIASGQTEQYVRWQYGVTPQETP